MAELQLQPSALTIAEHYRDLIDGFLLDSRDGAMLENMPVEAAAVDTLMISLEDRQRVATDVLALARSLSDKKQTHKGRSS